MKKWRSEWSRAHSTKKFIHSLSSINKVELIEKRSEFISFVVGPSAGTATHEIKSTKQFHFVNCGWLIEWVGLFPWGALLFNNQHSSARPFSKSELEWMVVCWLSCAIKSHPIHKLIPFHSSQLSSNSSCLSFMVEFISWDNF